MCHRIAVLIVCGFLASAIERGNASHAGPIVCLAEASLAARQALDRSKIALAKNYCLTKMGVRGAIAWYRFVRMARFADSDGNELEELQPLFAYVEIDMLTQKVLRVYPAKD